MLSSFPARKLFGFDLDGLAGAGISACSGSSVRYFPCAESGKGDLFALLESFTYGTGESLKNLHGVFLAHVGFLGDFLDKFVLVHTSPLPAGSAGSLASNMTVKPA